MEISRGSNHRRTVVVCQFALLLASGCCVCPRTTWNSPRVTNPANSLDVPACTQHDLLQAESAYASAFELEANGQSQCVDHYFLAAATSWSQLGVDPRIPTGTNARGFELYHSSLTKLIETGQRFGRFVPSRGLQVRTSSGSIFIPCAYQGFPFQPDDFDFLVPVGKYRTKELNNVYSAPGLGVAMVAVHRRRSDELFRKSHQFFAATAVLRPVGEVVAEGSPFVLELFDSVRRCRIKLAGRDIPLRRDISATMAYAFKDVQRNYLDAFLRPGSTDSEAGLFMVEPYQPGKIPIVLVHGLLSDPLTWGNIANELRARPELIDRYQIWGFEYATGEPFMTSAAKLREQLNQVQMAATQDHGNDAALSNTVLVGHSMGGLVSKLQVTYSRADVWSAVSNRPFASIITTPTTRQHLAESVFFDPSPMVSRVVYVGCPHRGSPWATRWIGRLGTRLVEEPSSMEKEHQQLLRDNPEAFSVEFTRRIPTSIDLLRSDSRLLQAIDRLPVSRRVKEHSIIGSFRPMCLAGPSDGVVPVSSARRRNTVSEKTIHARHTGIHQHREGIEEIIRILKLHLREMNGQQSGIASRL